MNLDFSRARELMVEQQVRPWDVLDLRVLDTIATLPREAFVPEALRALAYADTALPLGHGEAMMKPVLEGRTLQSLLPQASDSVLEIGSGSGYIVYNGPRKLAHGDTLEDVLRVFERKLKLLLG